MRTVSNTYRLVMASMIATVALAMVANEVGAASRASGQESHPVGSSAENSSQRSLDESRQRVAWMEIRLENIEARWAAESETLAWAERERERLLYLPFVDDDGRLDVDAQFAARQGLLGELMGIRRQLSADRASLTELERLDQQLGVEPVGRVAGGGAGGGVGDADAEPRVDAKPLADAEPNGQSDSGAGAEADAGGGANSDVGGEPEPSADAEPPADSEPSADTERDGQSDSGAGAEADGDSGAGGDAGVESGGEADVADGQPDSPGVSGDHIDICPVAGPHSFTDTWGAPRSGGRSHVGVDIMADIGTPVVAPVAGRVEYRSNSVGGRSFHLWSDDDYFYGTHLSGYGDTEGDVEVGEIIGYVGDDGNAAGIPHLHFEIHVGGQGNTVNPFPDTETVCENGG